MFLPLPAPAATSGRGAAPAKLNIHLVALLFVPARRMASSALASLYYSKFLTTAVDLRQVT